MLIYRYYTKYFGSDGIAGTCIAAYALKNYKNWEKQLDDWQDPILNNKYDIQAVQKNETFLKNVSCLG